MELRGRRLAIEACPSPKLRAALAYWHRVRGAKPMPVRADILPEEMVEFLAQAMMIQVLRDPFDLRWTVFGGKVAHAAGRDYTGHPVKDIEPPVLADLAWAQYAEAVEAAEPVVHSMEVVDADTFVRCHRISLPLSEDGRKVDRLLVVAETPSEFWEALKRRRHPVPTS